MHDYQRIMENIFVPENLNDRVLTAARQQEVFALHAKKHRPVWRVAICAALAVMLAAGGISMGPMKRAMGPNGVQESSGLYVGLPVKAVGEGANGGVLLEVPEGEEREALEGTTQTLTLTFLDGRKETGTYYLRTENLRTSVGEDGSEVLVLALEDDPMETVCGLYAVPEESVWFLWPVEGSNTVSLSAPYGNISLMHTSLPPKAIQTRFHTGIDIPAERGATVAAAAGGTVREAGFEAARGNYLILDHGDGLATLYGHCEELLVEAGDPVTAGQTIALVGATGMATGPHLHFEVHQDGEAQNPVAYFDSGIRDTLKMG